MGDREPDCLVGGEGGWRRELDCLEGKLPLFPPTLLVDDTLPMSYVIERACVSLLAGGNISFLVGLLDIVYIQCHPILGKIVQCLI